MGASSNRLLLFFFVLLAGVSAIALGHESAVEEASTDIAVPGRIASFFLNKVSDDFLIPAKFTMFVGVLSIIFGELIGLLHADKWDRFFRAFSFLVVALYLGVCLVAEIKSSIQSLYKPFLTREAAIARKDQITDIIRSLDNDPHDYFRSVWYRSISEDAYQVRLDAFKQWIGRQSKVSKELLLIVIEYADAEFLQIALRAHKRCVAAGAEQYDDWTMWQQDSDRTQPYSDSINIKGDSLLHYVILNCPRQDSQSAEKINLLLESGVNPNIANYWGSAILYNCGREFEGGIEIIHTLLVHGANPNVPSNGRLTDSDSTYSGLLDCIFYLRKDENIEKDVQTEILTTLTDHGADWIAAVRDWIMVPLQGDDPAREQQEFWDSFEGMIDLVRVGLRSEWRKKFLPTIIATRLALKRSPIPDGPQTVILSKVLQSKGSIISDLTQLHHQHVEPAYLAGGLPEERMQHLAHCQALIVQAVNELDSLSNNPIKEAFDRTLLMSASKSTAEAAEECRCLARDL